MLVDAIIILFLIMALYRGRTIGFVQQFLSALGFFSGLILGAVLQPTIVGGIDGNTARSVVTLVMTLGTALLGLIIGEASGIIIKHRMRISRINRVDNVFGSIISVVSVLIAVWLGTAVIKTMQLPSVERAFDNSVIARSLTAQMPYAPDVIAGLGHLISPNDFPQVFIGNAPSTDTDKINIPESSVVSNAVAQTRESVVKLVGQGCGGVVDGSGFVVGHDLVITNAHVIAGIKRPFIQDGNGTHSATPIWFDPELDLAVLRTSNLAGEPLVLNPERATRNTPAAVLGYPGGGAFTANPASVIQNFTATGRNIYSRGVTDRAVYEIAANVQSGNSGGPLINADGAVIGVIFAKSTTQDNVGYALMLDPVIDAIDKASARGTAVETGVCVSR